MKKIRTTLLAFLLVGGMTTFSAAQQKESGANDAKPGKVVVEVVKLTGTVKAVDPQNKTVTVEGSGGRTVTVNAENARNLDQVKVGDKVNLRYTEELALFVQKSDAQPSATQTDTSIKLLRISIKSKRAIKSFCGLPKRLRSRW